MRCCCTPGLSDSEDVDTLARKAVVEFKGPETSDAWGSCQTIHPYFLDGISLLAIPDQMASILSAGANINLSSRSMLQGTWKWNPFPTICLRQSHVWGIFPWVFRLLQFVSIHDGLQFAESATKGDETIPALALLSYFLLQFFCLTEVEWNHRSGGWLNCNLEANYHSYEPWHLPLSRSLPSLDKQRQEHVHKMTHTYQGWPLLLSPIQFYLTLKVPRHEPRSTDK